MRAKKEANRNSTGDREKKPDTITRQIGKRIHIRQQSVNRGVRGGRKQRNIAQREGRIDVARLNS